MNNNFNKNYGDLPRERRIQNARPCPWCNELNKDYQRLYYIGNYIKKEFCVSCWDCDCRGPIGLSRTQARLHWNNRPEFSHYKKKKNGPETI